MKDIFRPNHHAQYNTMVVWRPYSILYDTVRVHILWPAVFLSSYLYLFITSSCPTWNISFIFILIMKYMYYVLSGAFWIKYLMEILYTLIFSQFKTNKILRFFGLSYQWGICQKPHGNWNWLCILRIQFLLVQKKFKRSEICKWFTWWLFFKFYGIISK